MLSPLTKAIGNYDGRLQTIAREVITGVAAQEGAAAVSPWLSSAAGGARDVPTDAADMSYWLHRQD